MNRDAQRRKGVEKIRPKYRKILIWLELFTGSMSCFDNWANGWAIYRHITAWNMRPKKVTWLGCKTNFMRFFDHFDIFTLEVWVLDTYKVKRSNRPWTTLNMILYTKWNFVNAIIKNWRKHFWRMYPKTFLNDYNEPIPIYFYFKVFF